MLAIKEDVNRKDSSYWANNRPIPLTGEETQDYLFKDSLRRRNESKAYLDSMDKKNNTFKPLGFLVGGYNYRNRYKKEYIHLGGPISALSFNSVEGLAINYGINYSKQLDSSSNRYLRINSHIRYGFANRRLNGNASVTLPIKEHTFVLSGGSAILDLNNRGSLPVLLNSVYTLFLGDNYKKLYEKTFASGRWNYTIPGNVRIVLHGEWARRHWLPNASHFTLWDRNRHKLTSNNPLRPDADLPLFEDNNAVKISTAISYDFSNRYETYPSGKRYLPSKYPTISVYYAKGIKNIAGSDVDYDLVSASLYKGDVRLGMYGKISYLASAGKFLNNNNLYYPDYQHFNGNQILLVDQQLSSFLALDYYRYSTRTNFVEAHAEYNLSGLLTSKIPLMRDLKLDEIVGVHYLHTPELKNYGELHLGLQWKMIRLTYAHSRSNDEHLNQNNTLRIALKLF